MSEPAYTRLDVDERRRRLLELGADLFTRFAYDELSMAKIAKEAGISKALLYHYFPSKEAYFVATLEEKANELQQRTAPDPDAAAVRAAGGVAGRLPGLDRGERGQLRQDDPQRGRGARGAGAARPRARRRPRSASSTGCAADGAAVTAAAHGGARLARLHGRRLPGLGRARATCDRETLHGLLLGTLMGAVLAAGEAADATYGELDLLEVDDEDERLVRADRRRRALAP